MLSMWVAGLLCARVHGPARVSGLIGPARARPLLRPERARALVAHAKGGGAAAAAEGEELSQADVFAQRLAKVKEMREASVEPYAYSYAPTHACERLQAEFEALGAGEEAEGVEVAVCGRVTLKRVFGSLAFLTLQDESGTVQLYLEKKRLGPLFKDVKRWIDIGDIVGARGAPKRTDKGELSVAASEWSMLTKALRPLPDKWHGLTDVSKRYRARHLDLIVNPSVRQTFKLRAQITSGIRRWLDARGYLEMETPALHSQPGGAAAKPFDTFHNALEMQLTLRIATELHLKRLLVGGFERVYELGRIFRNEGVSTRHNPEFTTIELYQAYADFEEMMRLAEGMISDVCQETTGGLQVSYGGETIDLSPPWRRVTMTELVREATGGACARP